MASPNDQGEDRDVVMACAGDIPTLETLSAVAPRDPSLIHRLTYRRRNHAGIHVRGYKEEGTTTTPFDMLMLNDMDLARHTTRRLGLRPPRRAA